MDFLNGIPTSCFCFFVLCMKEISMISLLKSELCTFFSSRWNAASTKGCVLFEIIFFLIKFSNFFFLVWFGFKSVYFFLFCDFYFCFGFRLKYLLLFWFSYCVVISFMRTPLLIEMWFVFDQFTLHSSIFFFVCSWGMTDWHVSVGLTSHFTSSSSSTFYWIIGL